MRTTIRSSPGPSTDSPAEHAISELQDHYVEQKKNTYRGRGLIGI